MDTYTFKPEKSFIAACYWQHQPSTAQAALEEGFQRVGSFSDPTPLATERWIHAGEDNHTSPHAYINPHIEYPQKFATQFWFGCYETDGEYDYEIRAARVDSNDRRWKHRNHRLDVSRNGYLRLYSADEPLGHDPLANSTMLWRLPGFRPEAASVGSIIYDLELWSVHGLRIKYLYENDFPYLNEKSGAQGWLAMKIMRKGVDKL
ncbi:MULTISPECIES: hypothetical protein [unclassified Pseudomonas]|uniref:hypothetical protein n=1 Tax=Pseudomonas TaxID=286 RepID=UPI000D01FB2D|nr:MULTISPECIES: hypothetical protein [unclassified Pseudomonas]PRN02774.1 hypothetical protein A0O30_20755 [Pseudomonas sp. LLC-1]PYG77951.1 hypothetical protein N428_03069 [Pseudomonas sp. RV120224-01c]PYG81601.1 hypothetical protein N436_03116 [Pseudomonas sp. RV120224-01b]